MGRSSLCAIRGQKHETVTKSHQTVFLSIALLQTHLLNREKGCFINKPWEKVYQLRKGVGKGGRRGRTTPPFRGQILHISYIKC